MARAWRILDFSGLTGVLESSRGQIVVLPEGRDRVAVPVDDVAVVLIGTGVVFSGAALHRLTGAGIAVMLCDWRGVPEAAAYAWQPHTRIGARQIAQANATLPRRKNLWGKLIGAKISGQAQVLSNCEVAGASELKALSRTVRSGDPQNTEAKAARLYWRLLFGESFVRTPRLGVGRNACLDYGYMILRGHGIRAALAAGLAPALGVFHRGRSNPFNLVDDLMEPFRPAIDEAVAKLRETDSPDLPHVKKLLVAAADQPFASGYSVSTVFDQLAQQVGRYFEGDIDRVAVQCWVGPCDLELSSVGDGG